MLETTTTPMAVDLYRVLTPFDADDVEAWSTSFGAAMFNYRQTMRVAPGDFAWLVHAEADLADLSDIEPVEDWASVAPEKVRPIALAPLDTVVSLLDNELAQLTSEIEQGERRLRDLRAQADDDA